ncbi:MAG: hypothetical protein PHH93_03935 [Prolixibacteraceae bacterium]|nr:hypothetical protein [Prolixibacteraceae bacterium]
MNRSLIDLASPELQSKKSCIIWYIRVLISVIIISCAETVTVSAAQLKAGVAKVNITNKEISGPVTDSLHVKALVLENGNTKAVIITVDAVAIGRIGSIGNDYPGNVRRQIKQEFGIEGTNVMINASHLHGAGYRLCPDVEQRTIQAVREACRNMVPVSAGVGSGYEDRITENHLLLLTNGQGWAIRHANPIPPDEEIASVGPIDPEIGILRLDKRNGETLAVLYNFTGHPYPSITSQTDAYTTFATKLIEDNTSKGTIAMFVQGFCGDVIPVLYKDVSSARDQSPLGNMLGLSAMEAFRKIQTSKNGELKVINEIIRLPKRNDFDQRIESMKKEQESLLRSLRGTSLNFKTFLPLYINYNLHEDYPSYYSHMYLNDKMHGRNDMEKLDNANRRNIDKYIRNIHAMEKLSRLQYNISLVEDRKAESEASPGSTIDVEVQALRIGDFVMVTFPAEVSVQVGLNIKKMSPFEHTFVAGYTNGYLHYTPTAEQIGTGAYQDQSCLLAPGWQKIYEDMVNEILKKL